MAKLNYSEDEVEVWTNKKEKGEKKEGVYPWCQPRTPGKGKLELIFLGCKGTRRGVKPMYQNGAGP